MKVRILSAITTLILTISPIIVEASMRCDNGIVNEGDNTFEVLKKCGEPIKREKFEPVVGDNGKTPYKSMPVENWVYGPNNGTYRFLKFIDGTLVKVESRRL